MSRIELSAQVADDIDRIVDHLAQHEVTNIAERIHEIITAIDVLAVNPLIGRHVPRDRRELIIGRDNRGYIAMYQYVEAIDTVLVLALRSQREAGYAL
jgi:toxin ParE1/3/4